MSWQLLVDVYLAVLLILSVVLVLPPLLHFLHVVSIRLVHRRGRWPAPIRWYKRWVDYWADKKK